MDLLLLAAQLIIAAVFAVAGIAKLVDLPGSRRAVAGFGVPERLAAPLGLLLPLAELAIAIALLPTVSARWGGLGALTLTLVFIAAIGGNLARGRTPDCHCFGQLHSEPASWPTLGRNAALAVVAGFVLWQGWDEPQFTTASWLGDRSAGELAGIVGGLVVVAVLAVEAWLLTGLVGQNGRLLLRIETLETRLAGGAPAQTAPEPAGLPAGTAAPTFTLPDLNGTPTTLDALRGAGRNVVLLFTSPGCGVCTRMLPDIAAWQRDYGDRMTLAVVSLGGAEANRAKIGEHAISPVLLQDDFEVARAYGVDATPSAVVVLADGTIGSPVLSGPDKISELVRRVAGVSEPTADGRATEAPAVPVGQPAPAFALPALAGETVSLEAFRGDPTLVLFWSPACGFCQKMLPDLQVWAAGKDDAAPRLLVVSRGTPADHEGLDVPGTVVLDNGAGIGHTFGSRGTPAAILIDGEGNVASELARGMSAVLAMARKASGETQGTEQPEPQSPPHRLAELAQAPNGRAPVMAAPISHADTV